MNVRIEYPAEFLAAAHWEDSVLMNCYSVRCEMITGTNDAAEQNVALERLKWILFQAMHNSVFIDAREKATIKRLEAAGLKTVPLPAPPVDQVIGMMLYDHATVSEFRIGRKCDLSSKQHGISRTIGPAWLVAESRTCVQ